MRLMVTFEHRFMRAPNRKIYTRGTFTYSFLSRYLNVFDEVLVLSRVEDVDYMPDDIRLAEGPDVIFNPLPCYHGPVQYFQKLPEIKKSISAGIERADAFILRVAGAVGTLVYKQLVRKSIPFGIEVVADPWDLLAEGSVKSRFRPLFRYLMKKNLKTICLQASASSYVTEHSLQKRYPPAGWSTYYSSIDLSKDSIADDNALYVRERRIADKIAENKSIILCCTGQMSQLYKAQDILISAFAKCVKDGLNINLWLIGDGNYRSQFEQQAKDLAVYDKVTFWGNIPSGKAIFDKLDHADIFVLPSRQEGLPRAMIEAMARGLPCIGSSVGGFVELIDPENMVPPDSVELLAKKINTFVQDPPKLKFESSKNLQKSKEYCQTVIDARRKIFYERIKDISK